MHYSIITKGKHVRYFREHYRLGTSRFLSLNQPIRESSLTYVGRGTCTKLTLTESKVHRASERKQKAQTSAIGYQLENKITMLLGKENIQLLVVCSISANRTNFIMFTIFVFTIVSTMFMIFPPPPPPALCNSILNIYRASHNQFHYVHFINNNIITLRCQSKRMHKS